VVRKNLGGGKKRGNKEGIVIEKAMMIGAVERNN